jgi:hypothetical protein
MAINYNALIMRKLTQCSRWSIEGNKELAKQRFDEAWKLKNEVGEHKLDRKTVSAVYWLRDNFYEVKSRNWKNTDEPKWMQRKFEEMEADHAGL